MRNIKIYADTSVFGGVFDQEFSAPSKQFFNEVDLGRFELVTSAVVEAEVEPAQEKIKIFFTKYAESATIADISKEALELQSYYCIRSGHRKIT